MKGSMRKKFTMYVNYYFSQMAAGTISLMDMNNAKKSNVTSQKMITKATSSSFKSKILLT